MFNARRELLLTRSFFHEATNQIQKTFSSTTIHTLQHDNDTKPPEDKSLSTIIYMFLKNFSKMYLIRIAFMLLSMFNKKALKKGLLRLLFNASFNMKNFRTSFLVAIIPFLYDLQHILGKHVFNLDTNNIWFTFISGFVASFVGISYENTTDLVRFIILSILGRVIHSIYTIIAIKNNYPHHNKTISFFTAFIIFATFNIFSYYVSDFKPITNLFDKYGLYEGNEKLEFKEVRITNNIFK